MTPQFNLLQGRFGIVGTREAVATQAVQGGRSWIAIVVRYHPWSHVELRKVVGYIPMEAN